MGDDLIAAFNRAMLVSGASNYACNYNLSCDGTDACVRTDTFIPSGACIGELYGEPRYIWDMTHSEYVFIDEDMVVDVSAQSPRQVLSFLREDNQSDQHVNAEIIVQETSEELHFYVFSTRPIFPGEEIVYRIHMR